MIFHVKADKNFQFFPVGLIPVADWCKSETNEAWSSADSKGD